MKRGFGAALLCLLWTRAVGAQDLSLQLTVDPPEAVLVVGGQKFTPHGGIYDVPRSLLKSPTTPILQAPGFAQLTLPALSLHDAAAYSPGPQVLHPNTLAGYHRRYPWALPVFGLALLLGGAGIYARSRRTVEEYYEPVVSLVDEPAPAAEVKEERPPQGDLLVGKKLGRYLIQERLGSGGMATVYRAVPASDLEGQAVAIKVIRPDRVNEEQQVRFQREIKLSMQLNHPNVLSIIAWGQEEGMTFLVMELVEGLPLSRYIPAGGMSLEDGLPFIAGIMEGLAYAHSLGIVHRDVKPENIMISNEGRVKVMDFGLARSQDVRTLTMMGNAMGTPEYMAPEQIVRGPDRSGLTDKTDQYALGCVIFEILTGRRPFVWDNDDPVRLITMHLTAAPPAITSLRPDLPIAVEEVINRMLAKEPEERYPSIKDAGGALYLATQQRVPGVVSSQKSLAAIEPARESQEISEETQAFTPPAPRDAGGE